MRGRAKGPCWEGAREVLCSGLCFDVEGEKWLLGDLSKRKLKTKKSCANTI